MKNGSIMVLKGSSQYNILRDAIDLCANAFNQLGYKTVIVDLNEQQSINQLINYLDKELIEFIFSFNGIGMDIKDSSGTCILNYYKIPFVTYLVDHPLYHYNRLDSGVKNLSIATFDRENVEYLKHYYGHLKQVEFIPFIGFEGTLSRKFLEREIDLLFVGTYEDPENSKKALNNLTGVFRTVADHVIELLLKDTSLSLEKALNTYLSKMNFEISQDEFLELMSIMWPVDKYIRNYFRDKVVRAVLDAGMKLTVYGAGWDELKNKYQDNLVILNDGNVDIKVGMNHMANAKIVLSVMPWFKDCIQDRIISTMLNGAVCVTDPSIYMLENLTDGKEIVYYSLDRIAELPNQLKHLLLQEEYASSIAEAGKEKAKKLYSTEKFVLNLLNFAPSNYKLHAKENLILKYSSSKESEIIEIVDFVKAYGVGVYNYNYVLTYGKISVDVFFDENVDMFYTMHFGKRMYYPKKYRNPEDVAQNYRFISMEQDEKSPHRYLNNNIYVEDGDVVIDAGVAEGNFSLEIIDKVSKLYLIECEEEWIEALEQTFKPYKHKVVFVKKYLSNIDDDYNITIDSLVKEKVNFIKMDIEGFELAALEGAQRTLMESDKLSCAICSYHHHGDEEKIKEVLKTYNYNTSTSKGYMFFLHDEEALENLELRRGLVFGRKE